MNPRPIGGREPNPTRIVILTCGACGRACEIAQTSEDFGEPVGCPLGLTAEWGPPYGAD